MQAQYGFIGDSQTETRLASYDEASGCWTADIPDIYLTRSSTVKVFVYVGYGAAEGAGRSKTCYEGSFTPISRPAPSTQVTPSQGNAWDALVTEINLTLSKMNTAISEANAAAEGAKTQAEAAQKAGTEASTAALSANTQAQRLANMNIQAQTREYGSGSTAQMADIDGKLVLTLGVGLVCSYLVSRGLAHPIRQLSDEVAAIQDKRTEIPKLSRTGIREIDGFSTAITQLSQDILDTSTKFLRIMDMASIELGGYEIREDSDKVFVTDNFFSMLGMQDANPNDVTRERFEMLMEELVLQKESFSLQDGGRVFTIPQKDGSERFVMLRITGEDEVQVGLVEDVTAATLERRRIEHERDYDVLTGLYNRRAFDARAKKLFRMPEKLGHAALLMMDMDNLKHINDTFGHDWGDRYINLAGQCFAQTLPQNTICARMSGDEFIVLFYGYDRRDEIRQVLNRLSEAIKECTALLPNGDTMRISISGGIAWYPENGRDLATLKKYADFAMYQVKHESKGEMGEFDIGAYNQEVYAAQLRREFLQMLRENSADYHFQPIFSAHTGRVAAYEALMRVKMQLLNSPLTVMKLAREMDKLYEVERLTAFKATSTFVMMQNRGQLHRNTKLFLNSIASSSLTDEDVAEFKAQFAELQNNLVIEITEEEEIDREALERKRRAMGDQGALALDDWGSGYSNSNSLLELSPDYIKVDITIICDIDTDADKQQLVKDIVEYAHGRGMKIVAEGIETEAELRKVIELGVDLLQGYFLAKPAASPSEIAPQALSVIRWMNR